LKRMLPTDNDQITALVARVLRIETVTWGDPGSKNGKYLANFEGQLVSSDSEGLYDRLANSLRPLNITPLFRSELGRHHVVLMPGVNRPKPSNIKLNLILFVVTLISVFLTGMTYAYEGPFTSDWEVVLPHILNSIGLALAFTASLLGILLAHEFGHYLMAVRHKTAATLPYFIPFPFSPLGTMGAVIVQKESHRNRRILLDIGMAGPLAGLIVAVPILLLGLALSEVGPLEIPAGQATYMEGNSILYLLAKYAVFGQLLPAPASYGDASPLMYWIGYFFTGSPTPVGGLDVHLHPVAFAGWAGILVTAINLIPAGQLDGGHILHGLFGRRAFLVLPFILVAMAGLGLFWPGWWLWAFLIFFMGRTSAEPLDQITPLDSRRKLLGVLLMIIFILVFTPVPLLLLT
jgi:membrane-associated protease RseP (regulator of RpoE activity)